jgi:putative salt-induced outer membrane protein YdiY
MPIPTRRTPTIIWWVVSALLILAPSAHAQRRDIVVMKNGDQLTGKIRKMEHGQLFIETPYAAEPIPLDWLQVERMESTARYQLETATGKRFTGTITKTSTIETPNQDFRIQDADVETLLRASDVVAIESKKSNFWRQMKGSVDFGFSYASGSGETVTDLAASTSYTSTKYQIGGSLNSTVTGKGNSGRTNRQDISINSSIFLSRHAFVGSLVDFLRSDQQSLNLRTTLGGGYGRYFIRTNRTQLSWLGGVVYTKESYAPSSGLNPDHQNAEALLALNYDWFRFNLAEFQTSIQTFPGLSDTGRFRSNLNSSFAIKITRDLFWKFSIWDTLDSKPPVNARKNELGVSAALGLKF